MRMAIIASPTEFTSHSVPPGVVDQRIPIHRFSRQWFNQALGRGLVYLFQSHLFGHHSFSLRLVFRGFVAQIKEGELRRQYKLNKVIWTNLPLRRERAYDAESLYRLPPANI